MTEVTNLRQEKRKTVKYDGTREIKKLNRREKTETRGLNRREEKKDGDESKEIEVSE